MSHLPQNNDLDLQHSNISEEEMGQLHSIHYAENAVARVRRAMWTGVGRVFCADCGVKIPFARKAANPSSVRCLPCQSDFEHL